MRQSIVRRQYRRKMRPADEALAPVARLFVVGAVAVALFLLALEIIFVYLWVH